MDDSQGSTRRTRTQGALRILMQIRANALTERGGDTVVMERLTEGLRQRGHHVDVDLNGSYEPREYDLVHLYNFCTPEPTEAFARKNVQQNVPYVVTTMYEDWPLFFNPMAATFLVFEKYLELGQPKHGWEQMINSVRGLPPAESQDNAFTAAHAQALIATGEFERNAILRDYPNTKRAEIYHCGCEVGDRGDNGDLFRNTYGVKDFVLCVGRLEWRKNQLMIEKALEDSDLPVVYLTSGFTYQPQYEALMRQFRRKGKSYYIGKVSPQLLASAFAASRCHVLPSWYELPGLVNIEAANYGTNCVVTDYGTIRDYLGDDAYYCIPDNVKSVHDAILAAYHSPRNPALQDRVKQFTWSAATERNLEIYQLALEGSGYRGLATSAGISIPQAPQGSTVNRFKAACEKLEAIQQAANAYTGVTFPTLQTPAPVAATQEPVASPINRFKLACDNLERAQEEATATHAAVNKLTGPDSELVTPLNEAELTAAYTEADAASRRGEYEVAINKFEAILRRNSREVRAARGVAIQYLATKRFWEASEFFRQAIAISPKDPASRTGLASAEWNLGNRDLAFQGYREVLREKPDHVATISYFVGACYELNKMPELEEALTRYLDFDSENLDILFALAGCFYRQGKRYLARQTLAQVTAKDKSYNGAAELLAKLDSPEVIEVTAVPTAAAVPSPGFAPTVNTAPAFQADPLPPVVPTTSPSFERAVEVEELNRARKYSEALALSKSRREDPSCLAEERALLSILSAEAFALKGELELADREFAGHINDSRYGYRALTGRAIVLAERGSWGEAEQVFQKALSLNPKHDVAVAGLGMCLARRNDMVGAWRQYQQALDLNPENMRALLGAIQLGYPLQKLSELEGSLARFLEFNPGNLSILYAHAGCCYAQGKHQDALSQLEKIKIFEPEHQLANELLNRIQTESGVKARSY